MSPDHPELDCLETLMAHIHCTIFVFPDGIDGTGAVHLDRFVASTAQTGAIWHQNL